MPGAGRIRRAANSCSVEQRSSFSGQVALFLRDIRIEHTLFALPFAWIGGVLGAQGWPSAQQFIWITLAVLGARTAAMAANRLFDRRIDAQNPRTAKRPLASGALSPNAMISAIAAGLLLLLIAAWQLNPLCVKLLPLAALGIIVYPLCKRFTWMVHFVLGAVDGLAPLGAYIAITGHVSFPAVLLFLAVTVWVAGFDIIYAIMDYAIDKAQAIASIPARFGRGTVGWLPLALHGMMIAMLVAAGVLAHAGSIYQIGSLAALGLVIYEARLLRTAENVFVLNERVFNANMAFSAVFFVTTATSFVFTPLGK